jgi:glycosyltransferase involved in cell wall biosynthesis
MSNQSPSRPASFSKTCRFAFVSDAIYPYNKGGKERRLHEVTRWLARRGHQVDIYTMNWWNGPRRIYQDGVRLHAIMAPRSLYVGERRSVVQALCFGLATTKLLFHPFDVLDIDHMPFFPLYTGRLVCALKRKQLIGTWHEVWGNDYWRRYLGRSGRFAALVERHAVRMPHHIVSVSEHTTNRLLTILTARQPIVTVPLGVDITTIDRVRPTSDGPDVLFAGRLLANKRVDVLILAISAAREQGYTLRCLVIGEGPERDRLEALTRKLSIDSLVTFLNFVEGDEIYRIMKSARVFVLPSVREGFGLAVLEANACGTPVVTVCHADNAARHLIQEGRNGYVVGTDPEAIAQGIVRTLTASQGLEPRAVVDARRPGVAWGDVAQALEQVLQAKAVDAWSVNGARNHRRAASVGTVP